MIKDKRQSGRGAELSFYARATRDGLLVLDQNGLICSWNMGLSGYSAAVQRRQWGGTCPSSFPRSTTL